MKKYKKASDIKVGVIGYGGAFNMGLHHFNEMCKAGMKPAAVAELDPDRRKVAEEDFPGMATYKSVTAMLKQADVDLVTIITPHNTHAKLALQCLRDGKHVVCEKPFAVTTTECNAMIAEAEKRGLVLSTYHNRHWDGCILRAVKQIRKGVIGDLYRIDAHMGGWGQPRDWWRSSKSVSGGVLYDWGVHLLEYSLQLIDSDLVEVSGYSKSGFWSDKTKWKDDTNEDEVMAVARFADGVWLSLNISTLDSNARPGIVEFHGTKGCYVMSMGDYEIITPGRNGKVVRTKGPNPAGEGWRFYQNIADHMTRGAELEITPQWARRPIHIIDLAGRSVAANRAMKATHG